MTFTGDTGASPSGAPPGREPGPRPGGAAGPPSGGAAVPPPAPPSGPPPGGPVVPPSAPPSGPPSGGSSGPATRGPSASSRPWSEPPPGGPPSAPRARSGTLVLRVSRRILWVGTAAIPLHNITRVEAFKLKPDRGAAFVRFLRWLVVAAVIYVVINYASEGEARIGENGSPVVLVVLIALAAFALRELFQPATPVLAVETAAGSTAYVTLPSVEELQDIAGRIAHAIDNPSAEFAAVVQQFNGNNTNNYGPVVNMNGGRNNRGINL
ncbi:DUF6232 family protein [Streptomyces sp. NPDC012693]|uniref:DUF6232 family protein n=1 Tax=Streptomyces sp. NPDC012693 TaxID=3364844 RepID=UPI0036A14AAC